MTKLKLLLICVCVAVIALLSMGTLAYFSTQDTAYNVVKAGALNLEIHGDSVADEIFRTDDFGAMPGDTVSRIVTIENTCDHPMYVRVRVTKSVNDDILSADECISFNTDKTNWTFGDDGYYYYNTELAAGEITQPFFTEVYFDLIEIDNSYIGKKFNINVQAFAVQSEHNGQSPQTAIGWSED